MHVIVHHDVRIVNPQCEYFTLGYTKVSLLEATMKHKIRFRLRELIKELEIQTGDDYSTLYISEKTGLHRHTIFRLIRDERDSVSYGVIARLLDFFYDHGMTDVTIADLYEVTREGD